MAKYNKLSPYLNTDQKKGYLDVIAWRSVNAQVDDVVFTVTASYEHRPDLLAFDLYGDVGLWWVFAVRNPSVIKDPVFDMVPGIQIYIPQMSAMKQSLGI